MTLAQNNAQAAEEDEEDYDAQKEISEEYYTNVKGAIEKVRVLLSLYLSCRMLTDRLIISFDELSEPFVRAHNVGNIG